MCVFVTVKNVVQDSDKDLAQARSLSLSPYTICLREIS
jgi:hypothetical protein